MDINKYAVEVFNKHARIYEEKYMDVSLYSDCLDLFCDGMEPGADILDVACGPGNITKYLSEQRNDLKIHGIDLSENMIELAKKNNPNALFEKMDCRDIGMIGKKFNGIIIGFCLPYISKEETFLLLKDAVGLLKPEGLLYISTMEDDYSNSGWQASSSGDKAFMYFHQEDYLADALIKNGMDILNVSRKEYHGRDGKLTTDLIIISKKVIN